jgi:transglutaminase-like putative cysteine protease
VHQLSQQGDAAVKAISGPAAQALTPVVAGAVAGLAVALAATSLAGILIGARWWGLVVVTTVVVVVAGGLLRWLRIPPFVVAIGQLAVLVGLVTAVFTRSGQLLVLPTPASVTELSSVFGRAAQQVRDGIPPVPESAELLCLVVVAIGLVAIAVDTLAVSAAAPAASGVVLVGVVAVPAALSDQLLPWWSFALGTLGFALLLTVGNDRIRLRRLNWANPAELGRHLGSAPAAIAVGASAMVAALVVGASTTAVGTGLPGRGSRQISGIGLNPFTSLRGQLNTGEAVDLFRIRGLEQRAYLRALTLSRFDTQEGWQRGPLDSAVPAADGTEPIGRLPLPEGVTEPVSGSTVQVQIEPINYVDTWLPSFGYPLVLTGIGPDWDYDPNATTIFSDRRQRAQPYTELGILPQPDLQQLRTARSGTGTPFAAVDRRYLDTDGVDPRVARLAAEITADSRTAFDATVTVNQWFSRGFSYDLRTAPGNSGDALVDFLFTGRRGYCEQFASAMAIMLRTLRVPARVAVGFTPGIATDDSRLITTEDAHAWVEVWFPGAGWLPFDPTPLSDGRTVVPGYVAGGTQVVETPPPPLPPAPGTTARAPDAVAGASLGPGAGDPAAGGSPPMGLTIVGLTALAALVGLTPLTVRQLRRRRRLHLVGIGGPDAVSAAWEEVLAESADRGVVIPMSETVRATARRLAHEHALDEPGQAGLYTLVDAVERAWYGSATHCHGRTTTLATARSVCDALDAVRASLARCCPPTRLSRLLPRSVLRRRS